MRNGSLLALFAALSLLVTGPSGPARAKEAPPAEPLELYRLVLLERGPAWSPGGSAAADSIQAGHLANIRRMYDAGELFVAGPFGDNTPLRGIFVLRTDTSGYLPPMLFEDPAIKAGRLHAQIFPWYATAGLSRDYRERAARGEARDSMVQFSFVLLRRGPRYTSNVTAGVRRLLEKHQQHAERLRRDGALVAAGSVQGLGDLRGVMVFQADTAATRRMLEKDPAVRGGRFNFELHPWWTAYGMIPGH